MIKKTKEQKGITLVALVITIIVLLILAGVTLSIVWNGGIIEKSQNAVERYQNSSEFEENQVENLAARFDKLYNEMVTAKDPNLLKNKVKIGDYIEYDPTAGVENPTTNELLKYTSPIGELSVTDASNNLVVYEKAYNADDYTGTKTDYTAGKQVYEYNGAYNLLDENGNFVTTGYIYDKDSHGNGYSSQNFQAKSSNNLWRVLDDGSVSGTVKIIPENEIKTTANAKFYMKGLRGYKNAVTELNNISAIFGHGTGANGAQSITVEEVNALTGYIPATATSVTVGGSTAAVNKAWYKTDYSYQGTTYPGTSGQNSNGIDNAKMYEMLIKRNNITNRVYWLASHCVSANSYGADFRVRFMFGGRVGSSGLCYVKSGGSEGVSGGDNNGVLPVVSLQSSVNYKDGDGSSGTPWTFQ